MAELTGQLLKSPPFSLLKNGHSSHFSHLSSSKSSLSLTSTPPKLPKPSCHLQNHAAGVFPTAAPPNSGSIIQHQELEYQKLLEVHSIEEFDNALVLAKDNLVLVEYTAGRRRSRPLTVELSRRQNDDVFFILVKADESEKTMELCRRENVRRVPHYSFYKNRKRVHERSKLTAEEFIGYGLYYGSCHESVIELRCKEDVEKLMDDHKADKKLVVVNVGMRNCEPCVRVFPTMVKLSEQMNDGVLFGRLVGDDNESCMEFVRNKNVVRVPTFLFIRDGEIRTRYVGSERAKLVRKVLQYYKEC